MKKNKIQILKLEHIMNHENRFKAKHEICEIEMQLNRVTMLLNRIA